MIATRAPGASFATVPASRKFWIVASVGRRLVITCIAPVIISQPVAPRKPPITGKGTKRIARPACVKPSTQSSNPVSAVVSDRAISVGASRSVPPEAMTRWITLATSAASTTEVELSGPATAKDSELRSATITPAIAADKNVTAMP